MREEPHNTELDDVKRNQREQFNYLKTRLELLEKHLGIKYTEKPRYEKESMESVKSA